MPPLRLTLARAVSGLRRPKLASAKELNLSYVTVRAAAPAVELPISSDGPIRRVKLASMRRAAPGPEVFGLTPPAVEWMAATLEAPATEEVRFTRAEPRSLGGRAPWRPGSTGPSAPTANGGAVGALWPVLQLPYLPDEEELGATSEGLQNYQMQAVEALLKEGAMFLADDPGTDKLASVAVAVGHLVQTARVRRTLLLAPASRHLRWLAAFSKWTPGLGVARLRGEESGGRGVSLRGANLILTEYAEAVERRLDGASPEQAAGFDLVIADSVLAAVHKIPQGLAIAVRFKSPRRWALAGGLPDQAEDWRTLFGFLLPGQPIGPSESAGELQERLAAHLLRRTKEEVAGDLPNRHRIEHWLELDDRQLEPYESTWAEEGHMLSQLGEATSRTHIESALGALNRATAFAQGSLDGVKVRALADLLEAVGAAGDKVVVFSQYRHRALEPLQQALHAYGALRLHQSVRPDERDQILSTFRRDPKRRVLLAHLDARADGEPLPASYIVHFDIGWNSARRIRAEQRFFPELRPDVPLTIFEYWVKGTHDEGLHEFLAGKGLLAGDLPLGTRPAELEERMTVDDWRQHVFGTLPAAEPEPRRSVQSSKPRTTGLLPGTAVLRSTLAELSSEELRDATAALMGALGFAELVEVETDDEGEAGAMLLARSEETGERVLVRVRQQEDNVGVAVGRELLAEVEERGEAEAAYLVTTSDFTAACKALAEESDGVLALVAGSEFFRHLRVLGWL